MCATPDSPHTFRGTTPPLDPSVGLSLGPYGGPRAGAFCYKRGSPVTGTAVFVEQVSHLLTTHQYDILNNGSNFSHFWRDSCSADKRGVLSRADENLARVLERVNSFKSAFERRSPLLKATALRGG